MRRFHRWFGVGSAAIILLAVATGLLWAYAPYLYWEEGYMERKRPVPPDSFEGLALTHEEAIRLARSQLGEDARVSTVTLRSESGRAYYEVAAGEEAALLDARSGTLVSPLTPELAVLFARQYIAGELPVKSVDLLPGFHHRKGAQYRSVYRVEFDDELRPTILLSATSGQILEEEDEVRRFHFWVMRLHQLNFFGFKKTLTIIPGGAILLMLGSGLWLSRRARRRRRERTSTAPDVPAGEPPPMP